MRLNKINLFLKLESMSGLILIFATLMALIITNSPLEEFYQKIFQAPLSFRIAHYSLGGTALFWVNEGLMTIFFLLVGLELKREFIEGHLSKIKDILLPSFAALGGMVVPALIFILINLHHPLTSKAWSVPVATDIAFALGILSLFGKKVPLGLKLFLMALAIFDDVGAIVIIAVSHSGNLSGASMFYAGTCLVILASFNRLAVQRLAPYLIFGVLLWVCVLKSGVHATVAGVLLAALVPINKKTSKTSPLHYLEGFLHPWVAYLVLPLFALANAGLSFKGLSWDSLFNSVVLGIIAGLVIGKQVGVFSFSWLMVRTGWATLPPGTTWLQLYGTALLCGIGFTMSLFLGTLAFQNDAAIYLGEVRLGVLLGSLLSGLMGAYILHLAFRKAK